MRQNFPLVYKSLELSDRNVVLRNDLYVWEVGDFREGEGVAREVLLGEHDDIVGGGPTERKKARQHELLDNLLEVFYPSKSLLAPTGQK